MNKATHEPGARAAPAHKDLAGARARKPTLRAVGSERTELAGDLPGAIARLFFHDATLRFLGAVFDDHPIAAHAQVLTAGEPGFSQMSAWEDLASPTECLGLIAALSEGVTIEVLRASHRYPEFTADGVSRWMHAGRPHVAAAGVSPMVPVDIFTLPPDAIALVGPGLIHRIGVPNSAAALKILAIPGFRGSMRFRQQAPAGELSHRSGARIWI